MEILVISDTHKNISNVCRLLDGDHRFEHIIHLGDHVQDAEDIESIYNIPMTYVAGNCDYNAYNVPGEKIITVEDQRILLTHGHTYNVKQSLAGVKRILDEGRANIVLFGHSHRAMIEYCENGLLFNPGSISIPRDGNPSYGVIELKKSKKVSVNISRM